MAYRGPAMQGGRIAALDGLRGCAILAVVLFHDVMGPGFSIGSGRAQATVNYLLSAGWLGVDVFFVLSGFLITGILLDAPPTWAGWRRFFGRRARRILPLYYLFILLMLALHPAELMPRAGWLLTHLTNWNYAAQDLPALEAVGPLWSLAIEEQFYLLWPLAIFLLSRRAALRLAAVLIAISFATRVALALDGQILAAYVLTPARMEGLAAGAAVALWCRGRDRPIPLLPPLALVFVGTDALLLSGLSSGSLIFRDPLPVTVGVAAADALSAGLLLLALRPGTLAARALSAGPLVVLGRYSYALYLFHVGVRDAVRAIWPTPAFAALPLGWLLFLAIAGGAALGLAALSWHLFEAPILSGRWPGSPQVAWRRAKAASLSAIAAFGS